MATRKTKPAKPKKPDNRPRFGYSYNLDDDPSFIWEKESSCGTESRRTVVVIPLADKVTTHTRQNIRRFAKFLHG